MSGRRDIFGRRDILRRKLLLDVNSRPNIYCRLKISRRLTVLGFQRMNFQLQVPNTRGGKLLEPTVRQVPSQDQDDRR